MNRIKFGKLIWRLEESGKDYMQLLKVMDEFDFSPTRRVGIEESVFCSLLDKDELLYIDRVAGKIKLYRKKYEQEYVNYE